MANYFNKFPTLFYSFDGFKTTERVTNIISRYALQAGLKENTSVYYNYEVRDGDTPEILASKLYNDPEKHWIIMMMNNIIDVGFDWPLDYKTLNIFIDNKYRENANSSVEGAGLTWAKANIQSYYKVETIKFSDDKSQIQKFEIDANTYANTVVTIGVELTLSDNNVVVIDNTKETLSYYNYELENNESKRKIKLMRPEYVPQLEQEVRTAFL